MQSFNKPFDNFRTITGIGPEREKWLQKSLNIQTYQELAALTASQIESKLKEDGKNVSRKSIESWIEQARELISEVSAIRQNKEGSAAREMVVKFGSSGHQNGWTPFSSFLVYFQTREKDQDQVEYQTLVHYMEEDREESWSGIKIKELSAWLVDQISNLIELPAGEESAGMEQPDSQQKSKYPAEIKIDQVRIFQPVSADVPVHRIISGQTLEGELKSDLPFRSVVDFNLQGKAAKELTKQGIKCLARCYKYDINTKTSDLVAESPLRNLEAGKFKYSFEIPEASLQTGNYRIWVMVTTLQTDRLVPDFVNMFSLRMT